LVYSYDWEKEQNEKRRNIKILDPDYLNDILEEAETVIRS